MSCSDIEFGTQSWLALVRCANKLAAGTCKVTINRSISEILWKNGILLA